MWAAAGLICRNEENGSVVMTAEQKERFKKYRNHSLRSRRLPMMDINLLLAQPFCTHARITKRKVSK